MPVEIERKYLVLSYDKKQLPKKGYKVIQGYISFSPVVRIRTVDNKKAILSVKGKGLLRRNEWEFNLPLADGKRMLKMCKKIVFKTRYVIGRIELDVFRGALEGLVIAEVELKSATEKYSLAVRAQRVIPLAGSRSGTAGYTRQYPAIPKGTPLIESLKGKAGLPEYKLPGWLKCVEVTGDPRYQNVNLARFGIPN